MLEGTSASEGLHDAYATVRDLLAAHELSHLSDDLLGLARPGIRISPKSLGATDLPVGVSKFGGLPDLPDGVPWPTYMDRPLALLAQFSMPDVAPSDLEGTLPDTGMIYFFYDMIDEPWGYDPENGAAWKVLYCNVERTSLRRASLPPSTPDDYPLTVFALELYPELSLPPSGSEELTDLDLSEEEESNYWDVVNSGATHRLLGYPAEEQGDTRWEAQLASGGVYVGGPIDMDDPKVRNLLPGIADWQLLFQMDDDYDSGAAWFGGAGGRLFYSIRKQDLAKREFGNAWISFQWQ